MKRFFLLGVILIYLGLVSCGPAPLSPTPLPASTPQAPSTPEEVIPVSHRKGTSIRFETTNVEQGLSQSVVNAIAQDQQGFLWLGTQDGLNRFDGINFKVYKPDQQTPQSLSDGWVTALYGASDGSLWVGTNQGGLNRYDPQTESFTRYRSNPDDPNSLTGGVVQVIYEDRSGNIWVGTQEGLNRFIPEQGNFQRYQTMHNSSSSLVNNNVLSMHQDSKGNFWIGTREGLELFNPTTGYFKHYHGNPDDPQTLSDDTITAITEDHQGNLWIGTTLGLNRFDYEKNKFTQYLSKMEDASSLGYNYVTDLLVDRSGTLWIGTENGLDRFNAVDGKFTHYRHNPLLIGTLGSNTIQALYEDREGILWVGTWGGGLGKYSHRQDKFALYRYDPNQPGSLSDAGIFGIYPDESGLVWLSTFGGGLGLFDPATGQTQYFRHDSRHPGTINSDIVWDTYRDSEGVLWVGTENGLDRLSEENGYFIHYVAKKENPDSLIHNSVATIYEDRENNLWIGTRGGLDRFDRETRKFIHYSNASDDQKTPKRIGTILEDRAGGVLWIATLGYGLYRFDRAAGAFEHFVNDPDNPNSLANNIVLDIHQDAEGILWLATGGSGLSKFDPATKTFRTYTERDGLPNNFLYCVIADERSRFWISTNYGVAHFDPQNETFKNYTANDGLQSNEFNQNACAIAPDGAIYFGGANGLNRFVPAEILPSTYRPPVQLTALSQDGKPLETGHSVETVEEITLRWPHNSFEFEFAALSFAEPRKNQYAYYLENFENNWNYLGKKRDGRYTNLPGGQYILYLRGSNSDGVWNETGTAIRITVVPPFWETWAFRGLMGVLLIATVFAGYRIRLKSIENQKLALEHQVNERTREIERLFEQTKELVIIEERNRLARDLHDSAKQKAFAALAQLGTARGLIQHNVKSATVHITEAENLVYDVIQELTFLIQEMYPLALQEKGLVTTLREYLFEWENRTEINTEIEVENERRLPVNVEQALYRVVQESLANVARHSHAEEAVVHVTYLPENVVVTISDNGHGFDLQQKPNGIGLRSIRERVRSIGGEVEIVSTTGQGTTVKVTIPAESLEESQNVISN